MAQKVAVVTGGLSGMGRAVVEALSARGWHTHVVDVKPLDVASRKLPDSTTYHHADISDYARLAAAFKTAWVSTGRRLDFVFANGGVLDSTNFFTAAGEGDEPPPEPDYRPVEVNLQGCVNTVRLARHYLVQSPDNDYRSIAVMSSQSGIWPTYCLPLYTASKHGVIGFVRSVADWYHQSDGIRINTLCPCAVRTDLLPDEAWNAFKPESLTSMELVVKIVLAFCNGDILVDSNGRRASTNYGQTVVPVGEQFYLNDMPPFANAGNEALVVATAVDKQAHII